MELQEGIKMLSKKVKELEVGAYEFETIALPRYEADKKILETMRAQLLKMQALESRVKKGDELTQEEVYASIPAVFR